jgi:hypothetical protein
MASIKQVAMQFFEACETGKGWEGCKAYCKPNATFSAQAEPLADVRTLQGVCRLDAGHSEDAAGRPL